MLIKFEDKENNRTILVDHSRIFVEKIPFSRGKGAFSPISKYVVIVYVGDFVEHPEINQLEDNTYGIQNKSVSRSIILKKVFDTEDEAEECVEALVLDINEQIEDLHSRSMTDVVKVLETLNQNASKQQEQILDKNSLEVLGQFLVNMADDQRKLLAAVERTNNLIENSQRTPLSPVKHVAATEAVKEKESEPEIKATEEAPKKKRASPKKKVTDKKESK